jgi:hypothetical protein
VGHEVTAPGTPPPRQPAARLLDALEACLSRDRVTGLVIPTLADLQYEARAANRLQRPFVLIRGYLALLRVVVTPYPPGSTNMERRVKTLVIGAVSSVALVIAVSPTTRRLVERLVAGGPVQNFGIPAMLAVLLLAGFSVRAFRLAPSYAQAFKAALTIAVMMVASLLGWVWFTSPARLTLRPLAQGLTMAVLGSAFAAGILWRPDEPRDGVATSMRGFCLAIGRGALVQAIAAAVATLLLPPRPSFIAAIAYAASHAMFFVAAGAILYLPILQGIRRLSHRPVFLAVVGGILFPLPLITSSVFAGRLDANHSAFVLQLPSLWFRSPGEAFLTVAIPYVLAGAVLGWKLAKTQPVGSVTA